MIGRIIKTISNDYTVKSGKKLFICKARGLFRNQDITPMVGDMVNFDEENNYLLEILPRKNQLTRPVVANVDQAIIVTSVKEPDLSTNLLDKLLTIITYHQIKPIICFTKLDLLNDEELTAINDLINYYQTIGYDVITNQDQGALKTIFKDKLSVFTGQSGSGKSTLLNLLDKTLKLKTGEISKALGRGKHTTRHTELYEIDGGFIVDTPGFSSLDFEKMSNQDIRDNMNEMIDNLDQCKYRDCMHLKEDGCKVKEMVNNHQILTSRYENYCKFISRK